MNNPCKAKLCFYNVITCCFKAVHIALQFLIILQILANVSQVANLPLPLCNMRAHPHPALQVEMFMIRMSFSKKKHSATSVCLMQTIFAKLGNQKPVHTIRVYARYVCFSTGVVTSVCTFNLADVGG